MSTSFVELAGLLVVALLTAVGLGVLLVFAVLLPMRQRARPPGTLTLVEAQAAIDASKALSVNERGAALRAIEGQRVRWEAAFGSHKVHRRQDFATFVDAASGIRFVVDLGWTQARWLADVRPGEIVSIEGTVRAAPQLPLLRLVAARLVRVR